MTDTLVHASTHDYVIHVAPGATARLNSVINDLRAGKVVVVTDEVVADLHLPGLLRRMSTPPGAVVRVPAGEASKSFANLQRLHDCFADMDLTRSDLVIAFGGGVVGDLAGFAAATWLRGVRFIQAPTTLEAAIDASIGGKTGIDHASGKNRIGAFHAPSAVLIDTDLLATLPDRELRAGLAESVKHALIRDADFFAWHERHVEAVLGRDAERTAELITRNCRIKAAVVEADEREAGLRMLLNFGHTVGHAIEHLCGYSLRHGECVAIGMIPALRVSASRGGIAAEDVERVVRLLERIGLPTAPPAPLDPREVLAMIRRDKKLVGGKLHFVVLGGLGQAAIATDVTDDELTRAIDFVL